MSELNWLLANINQITVGGLLAFSLFALYRGWIVLGSTHRECRDDRDTLRLEVARYIQEDAQEKAALRHELELIRQSSPRRRS